MEVMNTAKENSTSPQRPAPEHAPWQGNVGEDLEEENKEIPPVARNVLAVGGEQAASHPSASHFGVGCKGRGLFAIGRYNISSCREEGQFLQGLQAFLPKVGANLPRQLDTSR